MNDTLPVPHPMSTTFMSDLIPNFTKDSSVDEKILPLVFEASSSLLSMIESEKRHPRLCLTMKIVT